MAFSFGAGNAAKLTRIPLYLAGRLATALIPRTEDRWVFGCGIGIGDGALALWDVVRSHGHDAVWLVGSAAEAADARARGIPHVLRSSIRGFWVTARARVIVVTHGFGDVNRYATTGAFLVQLWHGIPLKRIGADSPATMRVPDVPGAGILRRVVAALYTRTTRRIDLLPAASDLVRGRLESAFSVTDDEVPVTGEPRVDVLSRDDAEGRRAAARAAVADLVGALPTPATRIVLYAPTWRDGAEDPAVPSSADWRLLTQLIDEQDAVLLIRSHPLGAGTYVPPVDAVGAARVRSLGSDVVRDATPLLSGVDVLITDYSSMAFDAALVPVPTLFLAPDVEAYAHERGFYGTYTDVAGEDYATSWAEATDQLGRLLSDAEERGRRTAAATALSRRMHAFRDGRNSVRVYERILRASRIRRPITLDRRPASVAERNS